jgi:hypothetical protein
MAADEFRSSAVMSDHDDTPPKEESRDDEYAELWRRIVDWGWNPGDIFCTSQGVTWQFRETPYTLGFQRGAGTARVGTEACGSRPPLEVARRSAGGDTAYG